MAQNNTYPIITSDTPDTFALRILNWTKRRPCDPPIIPRYIHVSGFQATPEHPCQVHISEDKQTWLTLHGRVTQNAVTKRFVLSAIDIMHNQVALDLLN